MGIKDNVLFVRRENGPSESLDDIWDDSLLVKAYEKAINLAKEKLQRKENPGFLKDSGKIDYTKQVLKENKKVKKNIHSSQTPWKKNASCRAIYYEDNQEYEATVTELMPWKGKCIVRFIGYDNEEEVSIESLKPSRGERFRQCQLAQSRKEVDSEPLSRDASFAYNIDEFKRHTLTKMIPPPPALSMMSQFPSNEGEAFSSMLMSWYMSGYHTGYYQGLLRSRATSNAEWSNNSGHIYSPRFDEPNSSQEEAAGSN